MCKKSHVQRFKCQKGANHSHGLPMRKRAWGWKTWSSQRRHGQCLSLCNVSLHVHAHRGIHILFSKRVRTVVGVKLSEIYWSLPTAVSSAAWLPGHRLFASLVLICVNCVCHSACYQRYQQLSPRTDRKLTSINYFTAGHTLATSSSSSSSRSPTRQILLLLLFYRVKRD